MVTRFFSKTLIGLVSLTLSLFSSYKGIDVNFENFSYHYIGNIFYFSIDLTTPFTKDAENIFKSGEKIKLFFNLEIKKEKKILVKKRITHSFRFDAMKQKYILYKSEENKYYEIDKFEKLIEAIAKINYVVKLENLSGNIDIKLTSYLNKINIEPLEREYNMMAFWNWSKPYYETIIKIRNEAL